MNQPLDSAPLELLPKAYATNRMPKPTPLKCLSLFSGAGGLDLGLEAARFQNLGCIEAESTCRETLVLNRPAWNIALPATVEEAAAILWPRDLSLKRRELDLLAGGPPCQPFSKAAQWARSGRAGLLDSRAGCVVGFLEILKRFLPRAVLIENVSGFVQGPTSALPLFESFFRELNSESKTRYAPQVLLLNAADYGVPQRRTRAFLVAFRDGQRLPLPAKTHCLNPIRAGDVLDEKPCGEEIPLSGKWTNLLASIPEGQNYLWHTNHGGGRRLFGYRTKFWSFLLKLSRTEPAWTIPASPGPATGPFHWANRNLTVAERLVLQSFPQSWKLAGSLRAQIRQAGNATPPLLAEIVGEQIRKLLLNESYRSKPELTLALERRQRLPRKLTLSSIPPEFLHLDRQHADHPGSGRGPSPILTPAH